MEGRVNREEMGWRVRLGFGIFTEYSRVKSQLSSFVANYKVLDT